MKVAATLMNADFANVNSNLKKTEILISQAAESNAQLILLPEFFTSAVGFANEMLNVASENKQVPNLLKQWSRQYNIIIGGSYISFDGSHSYNLFSLVFPDGQVFEHKKDIPTQFENCYYTHGDENNILHTPIGDIGIAMCWEMIRYDTLRRLSGKVQLVLACSCWWDLPLNSPPEREALKQYNQALAIETPVNFSKLLGIPLVHSCHCGTVTAFRFPDADITQTRQLVGAAQFINADGQVIARRRFDEGESLLISDIELNQSTKKDYPDKFWIPDLPDSYLQAWETLNPKGEDYYKDIALPYYKKSIT